MEIAAFVKYIARNSDDTRTNVEGNTVQHIFTDADRYLIDFAPDFESEGWEKFNTNQDFHFLGAWVNQAKLQTLTYNEGDWYLVTCADRDHYLEEIKGMIAYYNQG